MALEPVELIGGLSVGIGIGGPMGAVVEPQLQQLANSQWDKYPNKPLDPEQAALAVVKGVTTALDLEKEARRGGVADTRLNVIEDNLLAYPGIAELIQLWRRKKLSREEVTTALARHVIPDPYRSAILALYFERLDPAVVATAVQRGLLPNDGILPVGPPTGTGKVPPMPRVELDPFAEAIDSGIDADRLKVLARIVGLPASPDLAARMVFRRIIDRVDFDRAISEGNTRNEWADSLFEGFRQIPTAHDGIEGRLRGWIDDAAMYAETARHGMSKADTDLLFKVTGRPLSFHQVFIGERRGGVYNGPTDAIDPAFLKSLRESNIRPEWYNLAWAQRYSYPSVFALRALAEAGDLTLAETHEILLFIGWPPVLAEKVAARWTGGAGAVADPNVKKAQTQLWSATHRSFVAYEADEDMARQMFERLGIAADAQTAILDLWYGERDLTSKRLTATQIKKAYAKPVTNPATGQPWTRTDAVEALIRLGYSFNDASTFLEE